MTTPSAVKAYLPILFVHDGDPYAPSDPGSFLEDARLVWNNSDFSAESGADTLLAQEFVVGKTCYRASDLTRPHDSDALRPIGLLESRDEGFCLEREDDPPPWDIDASRVEPTFPVFYEYVERRFITYWLFYEWSTLPLLPEVGLWDARADQESVPLDQEIPPDLHLAYPGLVASYPDELAPFVSDVPAPGDERMMLQRMSIGDVFRKISKWYERLRGLAGGLKFFPVMHEGDWERISVRLDEHDRMTQIAYYQHSGPPQIVAADASARPCVRVARGSHASYPPKGSGDLQLIGRVEQFGTYEVALLPEQLRDVRAEPWYGFGGAWGRYLGPNTNEVGPLGPSPYKTPTPFRMSP